MDRNDVYLINLFVIFVDMGPNIFPRTKATGIDFGKIGNQRLSVSIENPKLEMTIISGIVEPISDDIIAVLTNFFLIN